MALWKSLSWQEYNMLQSYPKSLYLVACMARRLDIAKKDIRQRKSKEI